MPANAHPNAHGTAGAYSNAHQLAADMHRAANKMPGDVRRLTRHYGMLLLARIQANASGRPGPRAVTGDYRRSWNMQAAGEAVVVGTDRPQARRLEYGFVGPDRIGRVYNQPPFPHVGPAVDQIERQWEDAIGDLPTLG